MMTRQCCQEGHCWCTLTTRGMRSCCRCGETYAIVVTQPIGGNTPGQRWVHSGALAQTITTGGTGPSDLIPLYELQQRQDAERIATLTKELERLNVVDEMLRSLASDIRTALAPEYALAVDDAQGDIGVNTAMMVAVRQREDDRADRITDLTDEIATLTARAERAEKELTDLRRRFSMWPNQ